MKAPKSGTWVGKVFLELLIVAGLWACASSQPSSQTQSDRIAFSINGTWEITQTNPLGGRKITYLVKIIQEGDKLFVTLKKPTGEDIPAKGTIKGQNVEWRFSYESMGDLSRGKQPEPETRNVQYRGKISKDGTMKGNIFLQDRKGSSWTAQKISKDNP